MMKDEMTEFIDEPLKFEVGSVVATPAVMAMLPSPDISALLTRHCSCDWGDLEKPDRLQNDLSVDRGDGRLFSRYERGEDNCIVYVITDADRYVTTILLSSEY